MEMKGVYDRGQPLVQMGILIASTLALAIVPLIAHHSAKKAGRGALPFIRLTFRTAFLFGWAAAAGLALVLPYVNEMLFETRDGSVCAHYFLASNFLAIAHFTVNCNASRCRESESPNASAYRWIGYKNHCKSTSGSTMGCHRSGNCRQYRFCSNYFGLTALF